MDDSRFKGDDTDLAAMVDQTRGFQPWRRAFHAMNGTLVVLAIAWFRLPIPTALIVLGIILVLATLLDLLRLLDPKLNVLFFRTFSSLASPREEKGIASSTWYAFSVFLALLLFPTSFALAGILVLAWADPSANLVGQRWGRRRFFSGTVLGTGTFFLAAFLALVLFVPWPSALLVAGVTAVAESLPTEVDDNLLVPLTVGGCLSLLSL